MHMHRQQFYVSSTKKTVTLQATDATAAISVSFPYPHGTTVISYHSTEQSKTCTANEVHVAVTAVSLRFLYRVTLYLCTKTIDL